MDNVGPTSYLEGKAAGAHEGAVLSGAETTLKFADGKSTLLCTARVKRRLEKFHHHWGKSARDAIEWVFETTAFNGAIHWGHDVIFSESNFVRLFVDGIFTVPS